MTSDGHGVGNLVPTCCQPALLGPFHLRETHLSKQKEYRPFSTWTLSQSYVSHARLDIIHSITLPSSLGFAYLHNPHSTLGRVRSCPQDRQTSPTFPAAQQVYFRSIADCRPSRTAPTPHDPWLARVAPSAPASSHKFWGRLRIRTSHRLQQELMWAWSGCITHSCELLASLKHGLSHPSTTNIVAAFLDQKLTPPAFL